MKPYTFGVIIRGVRETRKGEIPIDVGPAADGRTELSSATREVIGAGNCVRELVPRTEVEVLDLHTTTDVEEVMEAIRKQYKTSRMERHKQVDDIYTDFAKAFERVNHHPFLSKLKAYGV